MTWIRVTDKWEWKPSAATTIVYKPGEYNVPRAAATLAVAAGKAVRLRKIGKDGEPTEWQDDQPLGNSEIASA